MAGLNVTIALDYTSTGDGRVRISSSTSSVTPAAVPAKTDIVSVATSDASLAKGGVSTIGYVYLRNLDATNYILIGADGTNYPIKLKPGEQAAFPWNDTNVHAKANTAACNLQYAMFSASA